jgi:hypothetical protein
MIFKKISGYFIGQVRPYGMGSWVTITGRCRTADAAMRKAAMLMKQSDYAARAVFVDARGWHESRVAVEAKRAELEGFRLERV